MTQTTIALAAALLLVVPASGRPALAKKAKKAPKAPVVAAAQTEDQARTALEDFQKAGADPRALTDRFKPTHEDLVAILDPAALQKAETYYGALWSKEQIAAKPDQTDLKLHHATTDELLAGGEPSKAFPLGWRAAAKALKKGLVFYSFKFVRPGEENGPLFDGLVSVNGHFVWLPKLWNALK